MNNQKDSMENFDNLTNDSDDHKLREDLRFIATISNLAMKQEIIHKEFVTLMWNHSASQWIVLVTRRNSKEI